MLRTKKAALGIAVGAIAALALSACGTVTPEPVETAAPAPAPSAEVDPLEWVAPTDLTGSLTLYAANPQGLNTALTEEFTALTGVAVEVYGDTTGKITAKLDAEWENPQADVVYIASWSPAAKYADQGRLMDYQPFGIDSVPANWVGDGFTGRDGSALALVVNTNTAAEIPADWSDLAKPAFTDQIIMPDPRESGTARDLIAAMISAWGQDETWALFDSLFDNGLVVQGANGPALDDVVAGSHAVVVGGVDYSAYSAMQKGEAIQVVLPKSGTTVSPRPFFILKDAQNPEAAKALVDFFLSRQGQAISAEFNMLPAQPSVPVREGNVPAEELVLLDYSLDEIATTGADALAAFVERYLP